MPDRSLVIKTNPLVSMDSVGYLHLIIPNVGAAVSQNFTNL